jgi:hypothetical protein
VDRREYTNVIGGKDNRMALTEEQWDEIYRQADEEQRVKLRQDRVYSEYRASIPKRNYRPKLHLADGVDRQYTHWRVNKHPLHNQTIRYKLLGIVYHLYYWRDWRDTKIRNYILDNYSEQWQIKTCSRKLIQTAMRDVDSICDYCYENGEAYPWDRYGEVINPREIRRYLAYKYRYPILDTREKEKQVRTVRQTQGRPMYEHADEIYALREQGIGARKIHKEMLAMGMDVSLSTVQNYLRRFVDKQLWKNGIRLEDPYGRVLNQPDED